MANTFSGQFTSCSFGHMDHMDSESDWPGTFNRCTFTNIDFGDWYDPERFTNCQFYGCYGIPPRLNQPISVN